MAIIGDDDGNNAPLSMEDVTPDKSEPPFPTDYLKKGFGESEGGLEMRKSKNAQ